MSSQELDHQSNGVHFFKIILQSIIEEGKLRVPISFVRRHWQGITNPVTLRLPNMTQKKVFWEKTSDYDVCFCNGWKEFANYLSLGDSQLLVFQYQGNSLFKVIVFGKCGLELKYPSRETSEEFEGVEESDSCLNVIENKKIVQARAKFHNFKDTKNGSSCDDLIERSKVLYEKVKKQFNYKKNFFACMILKSYIERDLMVIPNEFVKTHMHKMKERNVTLFVDQDHRTWTVDLKFTSNKLLALTGGWSEFCAHNNVKIGDICAFVRHKCKGTNLFQVAIFSLEKEMKTPYFEGLA